MTMNVSLAISQDVAFAPLTQAQSFVITVILDFTYKMKQVTAFLVLIIATTAQMNLVAHSVRMIISSIILQEPAKNAIFLVALLV